MGYLRHISSYVLLFVVYGLLLLGYYPVLGILHAQMRNEAEFKSLVTIRDAGIGIADLIAFLWAATY